MAVRNVGRSLYSTNNTTHHRKTASSRCSQSNTLAGYGKDLMPAYSPSSNARPQLSTHAAMLIHARSHAQHTRALRHLCAPTACTLPTAPASPNAGDFPPAAHACGRCMGGMRLVAGFSPRAFALPARRSSGRTARRGASVR